MITRIHSKVYYFCLFLSDVTKSPSRPSSPSRPENTSEAAKGKHVRRLDMEDSIT